MISSVFCTDYIPLLSHSSNKSAIVMYVLFDTFKNDQGIVQITYADLEEHMGSASSTIQKSLTILKKLQLIEEVEDQSSNKKYRLLPPKILSLDLKEEILKEHKSETYQTNTSLRKKYTSNNIPIEFQQLLNKKVLQKIYKELGSLKSPKEICSYLKIDYQTFRLLTEATGEGSFRSRFEKLVKEIELKKEQKLVNSEAHELTAYLYEHLKSLDVIPSDKNWFVKNRNMAKGILDSISLEEAKQALDWGFSDKWWCDKITNLGAVTSIRDRLALQGKKIQLQGIKRTTPIPEEIRDMIQACNFTIEVRTYEDAYFLKQSILDGQSHVEIKRIVQILEENGIIPEGDNNLRFA